MTTSVGPAMIALALAARNRAPKSLGDTRESADSPLSLGALSFDSAVLEILSRRGLQTAVAAATSQTVEPGADPAHVDAPPVGDALPGREATVIAKEADRTSVDPALLVALRKTENGGPGREFGVLSVAADGLEGQAHVAATTVRNNIARFEQRGGIVVDPTTKRYTEDFLRFLSARYAPTGATNDPLGLNRHHAANLIALYRRASGQTG